MTTAQKNVAIGAGILTAIGFGYYLWTPADITQPPAIVTPAPTEVSPTGKYLLVGPHDVDLDQDFDRDDALFLKSCWMDWDTICEPSLCEIKPGIFTWKGGVDTTGDGKFTYSDVLYFFNCLDRPCETRLIPFITITGRVVDQNGNPVAGAEINIETDLRRSSGSIRQ